MILIAFLILATGLLAGLYLFFSLKTEMQASERKQQKRIDEFAERLRQAEVPLESAGEMDPSPATYPLRSGFNLNKRVQAMRLLRRGEDISHIAAVLGVPQKEVELLIRVQQLTGNATSSPVTSPPAQAHSAVAGAGSPANSLPNAVRDRVTRSTAAAYQAPRYEAPRSSSRPF